MKIRKTLDMRLIKIILICSITSNLFSQVNFESSNLPVVIINTNGQTIPNSYKITADMGIIYNGPGERNHVTDSLNHYNGKIGIELRGSSSLQFPKKQYAFETRQETGENRNISLLGLPVENDWVLYAPYSDKSLIRNVLIYELSNKIGRYASRSRFCELVLNGNYQGIYVLLEKVKRDKHRIDISELDEDDLSGDDLTGGYIIKIDKRDGEEVDGWYSDYLPISGSSSIFYQYHYPRPDEILDEQAEYIENYVKDFEDMMYSWAYNNISSGYINKIDVSSFIDFFLLNEISKNVDGYRLSTFFYKDKNSKDPFLHIGPIWDFNLAFGNSDYYDGWKTTGWQVEINHVPSFQYDAFKIPFYWERLMNDRNFVIKIVKRWKDLRNSYFSIDTLYSIIDRYTTCLDEAQQRNFEKWPVLNSYVWPNYYVGGSYINEIEYLKNWISDRLEWMDKMLLDSIPPDGVLNLRISDYGNSSVTVAWDEAGDNVKISGYDVFANDEKVRYSTSFYAIINNFKKPGEYQIEVKARDYAGNYSSGNSVVYTSVTDIPDKRNAVSRTFYLYQNYPNPFNSNTRISFKTGSHSPVQIIIYDLRGRQIKKYSLTNYSDSPQFIVWNGKDETGHELSTGVYIYQLRSGSQALCKKMMLIK